MDIIEKYHDKQNKKIPEILVRYPNRSEKIVPIMQETMRIGSLSECEIMVIDNRLPKISAVITYDGVELKFKTCYRTELIKVNGEPVHSVAIHAGDKITIGDVVLTTFDDPEEDVGTDVYKKVVNTENINNTEKHTTTITAADKMTYYVYNHNKLFKRFFYVLFTSLFCLLLWVVLDFLTAPPPYVLSPNRTGLATHEKLAVELLGYMIGGKSGKDAKQFVYENPELIKEFQEKAKNLSGSEKNELVEAIQSDFPESGIKEFFKKHEGSASGVDELKKYVNEFRNSDQARELKEKYKEQIKEAKEQLPDQIPNDQK